MSTLHTLIPSLRAGDVQPDNRKVTTYSRDYLESNFLPFHADGPSPDYRFKIAQGRSDYSFVDSKMIDEIARSMDLVAISQRVVKCRNVSDAIYSPHEIRYISPRQEFRIGKPVFMFGFLNSHNGEKMLEFYAGVFRLICSNGLTITHLDMGQATILHRSLDVSTIFDGLRAALSMSRPIIQTLDSMDALMLSPRQQLDLAHRYVSLLPADRRERIDVSSIIEPRYHSERANVHGERSLANTYFTAQTKLVQHGGARYRDARRPHIMRAVKPWGNVQTVNQFEMELFRITYDYMLEVAGTDGANTARAESHGLPAPSTYGNRDIFLPDIVN